MGSNKYGRGYLERSGQFGLIKMFFINVKSALACLSSGALGYTKAMWFNEMLRPSSPTVKFNFI